MLPDGNERYKSLLGSLLNVIRVSAVLVYASYKWVGLRSQNDANIQTNVESNYFGDDLVFNWENGFKVGFGVTAYNWHVDTVEDPQIGTIKAYLRRWGGDEQTSVEYSELESVACAEGDFNG